MALKKLFYFWIVFTVFSVQFIHAQRKNDDPFARSARLPDFSLGLLFNFNSMVKYKVPGGSLALNTTYYNFDRRFLVGLEFTKNITQHSPNALVERDPLAIADQSFFRRLIYNQTAFGLRGGWMFNENLFLTVGSGVELLEQLREMRGKAGTNLPDTFLLDANKNNVLFYLKYGLQYKRRYFIYDIFYSKRAIGVGVNYFFNG